MDILEQTLNNDSLLASSGEALDSAAWLKLMEALQAGQAWPSATALLTAFHNIVTESTSEKWIPTSRRKFYCPSTLVQQLKAGIFAKDFEVLNMTSSALAFVPQNLSASFGIPGLASRHRIINCTHV